MNELSPSRHRTRCFRVPTAYLICTLVHLLYASLYAVRSCGAIRTEQRCWTRLERRRCSGTHRPVAPLIPLTLPAAHSQYHHDTHTHLHNTWIDTDAIRPHTMSHTAYITPHSSVTHYLTVLNASTAAMAHSSFSQLSQCRHRQL